MNDQAAKQLRSRCRKAEDDGGAKGIAHDVCWMVPEFFQERSEICNIVPYAALSCGALASTVTAPIVSKNAERARESRHHGRPVLMVAPRTVHQDERISDLSSDLPIDADSIDSTA